MRIAVTGATGNIGTAVLHRLAEDGDHSLVGLARRLPDDGGGRAPVEWVGADLTDDACLPALERAFTGADAVVHLAWGFQPSHDLHGLADLGVGGRGRVVITVSS